MKDEKMNNVRGTIEKNRSIFTIISFNVMGFGVGVTSRFINAYAFYFYEVEVGLPILFYTLAMVIYSIWDTINDPIVGYLSDKPHFYTKRWGRRFPWIIFGMIPISILFYFVFAPPDIDPIENAMIICIWLIVFLCILEFFSTAVNINTVALLPQKFRSDRDRRYSAGIGIVIATVVTLFGTVLPPLFIVYGDKSSFLTAILVIVVVSIPFIVLGIPGVREDKELIEQFLKSEEKAVVVKRDFLITMKKLLKNRNFIAMIALWIAFNMVGTLGFMSMIYLVRYVLHLEVYWLTIVMMTYLIFAVIGIPIWIWIIRKFREIKVAYISATGIVLSLIPSLFISDVYLFMILAASLAFFVCGLQCVDTPLFASVIDEVVVNERRRTEGVYNGVLQVILRIGLPLGTIIVAIVHTVTGFDPSTEIQTSLAQWGIRAIFGLIPVIFMIVGILLFRLLWNLTIERMDSLKVQLKELDL